MSTANIRPGIPKRRNERHNGFLFLSLLLLSGSLFAGPMGRIGGGGASFSMPSRSAPATPSKSYSTPVKSTKSPASSTRSTRLGGGESIGLQRESSTYTTTAKPKSEHKEVSAAKTAAPAKLPVAALVSGAAIGYMVGKSNKEAPLPQTSNPDSLAYYSAGTTTEKPLAPMSTAESNQASDPDMKPLPAPAAQSSSSETGVLPVILLLMALLAPLIFLWQGRSSNDSNNSPMNRR